MSQTTHRPVLHRFGVKGGVVFVVVVLIVALVVEYAVLARRSPTLPVSMPTTSDTGETWVVVGLDDRAEAANADNGDFGTGPGKPVGARADVIVLVRPGKAALSVSRDIVLLDPDEKPQRLGNYWLRSPQAFVDVLCQGMGIGATHLVAIDMRGFETLVDTLGGVEVDLPEARRDRRTGLNVPAGRQVLSGRMALALVRSRQGEVLRGGAWIADPDGEKGREARAGAMMATVMATAKQRALRNPALAHRLAWRVLPDVSRDQKTSLVEMSGLRSLPPISSLPVHHVPNSSLADLTDETRSTLASVGLGGECTPSS